MQYKVKRTCTVRYLKSLEPYIKPLPIPPVSWEKRSRMKKNCSQSYVFHWGDQNLAEQGRLEFDFSFRVTSEELCVSPLEGKE